MRTRKRNRWSAAQLFWITLAASTAVLITWRAIESRAEDPRIESLQRRADRIYSYDQHGGKLAFGQLAALSIALEFKDYEGATVLVQSLESQIH